MLSFLPAPLIGVLSFLLYTINTIFWAIPLLIFALLKWLLPIAVLRQAISCLLDSFATCWIGVNLFIQKLFIKTKIHVENLAQTNKKQRYLVISNHQSWVDIMLLQRIFHGQIPFLKFFLKKELIYVPVLGLAWWALDFPFMSRYSKNQIKKNPQLAGKDIQATRQACEKFKTMPVSIMNFVEGTRFSAEKCQRQKSPYKNLLKPKASGIAFVLSIMGDKLDCMLDVAISYNGNSPTFWEFLCGKVDSATIKIQSIKIDETLMGDYEGDKEFRVIFQRRINEIWLEKDNWLETHKNKASKNVS